MNMVLEKPNSSPIGDINSMLLTTAAQLFLSRNFWQVPPERE